MYHTHMLGMIYGIKFEITQLRRQGSTWTIDEQD